LATGATAKWLSVKGEEQFRGYGVSACATCDGFFYKGKSVCVIGGGNAAVEEALFLTHFAASVTLIHRRYTLRAEKIAQDRLFKNPKITVLWNHVVDEICGTSDPLKVTHLKIKNVLTDECLDFKTDGVFVAIGHTPQTDLVKGQLTLDGEGYIIAQDAHTKTNIEGVFAAGDVVDKVYRQAITAAGMGCQAALEAERYLQAMD